MCCTDHILNLFLNIESVYLLVYPFYNILQYLTVSPKNYIMSFSNCLIRSFWLGKSLQTEELSNVITRKEEIRTALNKWQSCLNPRVRQLLENNSLNKYLLDCNIPIEKGLLKENAFIGLRNST